MRNSRKKARNRTAAAPQQGTYIATLKDGKVYVRKGSSQSFVAEIFDLATRTWSRQHADVPDSFKREVEARFAMSHA